MPTGSIVMPGNRVHQRWHRFDLLCYASLKCSSVLRLCGPPCPRLPLGFAASPGKTSPGSPRKMRRKWLGTKDLRRGDGDAKYKTFLAEKAPGFLLVNHHRGKRAGSAAVAGEGGGGAHQVVFWSCECRALGPDFSEKCNKRKPSYFPEIFVTIQVQRCFSAEISVTGFFAATSNQCSSRQGGVFINSGTCPCAKINTTSDGEDVFARRRGSCMVVRKCLGISEDSCFCGTSDDLSLGSSVIIGSGEERSQAKGSLALCAHHFIAATACQEADYGWMIRHYCLKQFQLSMEGIGQRLWCDWDETMG
nr:PREDICTED: receptor activity-modifying protein 1 [Opisthocomus hoazin]